jgi:hypothetical protein
MTILYSPIKIFLPFALIHLVAGLSNYAYTYVTLGRFTNMSAVLISASVIIFLIGLISEQITMLMYAEHHVNAISKRRIKARTKKNLRKFYAKVTKENTKSH